MRRWLAFLLLAMPGMAPAQSTPQRPFDFSALIFGNYQMRTDSAARVPTGGKPASRFDVGRAYLTFRAPAGDRASIRITTDILQTTAGGYYSGWTARLKYAILQYDLSRNFAGIDGLVAAARIGMLHTVTIEHVESFWPRWLGSSALETHGFFSSADAGAATLLTLPKRRGEAYFTITNGPGYTSGEIDRFKDVAARVSFSPFASDSGLLRTLTISPWYYKGWTASQFVLGGPTQVGPVSDGVQRDRRGVFVGLRERKLVLGAEFSQRLEEVESGANTTVSPRTVASRTSSLASTFAVLRPLEIMGGSARSRLALVGRVDQFTLDTQLEPRNRLVIGGLIWDLTDRTALALDYQSLRPSGGSTTIPTTTWFLHWTASF